MAFNLAVFLARSVGGVGVLGGVVGGSAALAKNIKKKNAGEITNREMAIDTGKETVGAGVATAFSAFSAGLVGGGLAISLGTAFIAAAAGKYAWDHGVEIVEAQIKEKLQSDMDNEIDEAFAASSRSTPLISAKEILSDIEAKEKIAEVKEISSAEVTEESGTGVKEASSAEVTEDAQKASDVIN